ncbi:class I SAM-dependent DNA methyltransferase [Pseudahrensia aquimaris]|uniref:Class I SAM-dependent DNA methyltransferase n=1 Tax=Pseudahrensia aquimaris TaxID=744461 RepID=A0ABW3FEY6_9HYPH
MSSKKNSHDHGIDKYHDLPDDTDALARVYADWANAYDHDNDHKLGTVSQPNAAAMLARHVEDRKSTILDVGCGTGLVGHHLAKHGFTTFDGADLSAEMLAHARTRGYRTLFTADAAKGLDIEDATYDATLCVGVFTHGHLGAESFKELLRLTRPDGIIVFTVNEGVWETGGFDREVTRLSEEGAWSLLEQSHLDYMIKEGVRAWYVAARKT